LGHVVRWVWVDVIGKAISIFGHICDLLNEIYSIGILSIDAVCADQLRLMGKRQVLSIIIIGEDIMSISGEIALRIIENSKSLLFAVILGELQCFIHISNKLIYLFLIKRSRYVGEIQS